MSLSNLFHPFIATDAKANWEGYTSPRMDYFGGDIPGSNFNAGFLVATREGYMDIPHIHDGADNYFILTGPDLTDIFNSEFEVNMFLGDSPTSMEMYKITKPSIVRIPAGVWHCPMYYKNVIGGINTIMWYAGESTGRVYPTVNAAGEPDIRYEKDNWVQPCQKDPDRLCTYCGACFTQTPEHVKEYMAPFFENMSPTRKYENCIYELKPKEHKLGDAVVNPRVAFKGGEEIEKIDRHFSINIITEPCKLGDDEPVSNGQVPEYLWFSGADAVDPWTTFDAEIEIELGTDPDNMETVIIDKPGVVAVPPGIWRGAVTVRRAGKPVCFMPWYPHTQPRYKITRKFADGEAFLAYNDKSTIKNPTAGDELYMMIDR